MKKILLALFPYWDPMIPPKAIKVLPMIWPKIMAPNPSQKPMGARKPPAQISARDIATPAHKRK